MCFDGIHADDSSLMYAKSVTLRSKELTWTNFKTCFKAAKMHTDTAPFKLRSLMMS